MRIKLIALLIIVFGLSGIKANAIPVFYSNGNTITTVKELPYTEDFDFETRNGTTKHVDLGVMHQEFAIFGIPVWNYGDYKYVLFHDNGNNYNYTELDKDGIETMRSLVGDMSDTPELPFWNTIGGKLLVLGVIVLFIVGSKWLKKNNNSDSDDTDDDEDSDSTSAKIGKAGADIAGNLLS